MWPVLFQRLRVYNLTDGYHPSFKEHSSLISQQLNKKCSREYLGSVSKAVAAVGDMLGNRAPVNSVKLKKITSDPTFDDSKACVSTPLKK